MKFVACENGVMDGAARAEDGGECLHELFERQASAKPDAEAVVAGARRLSYAELNRRANGIASRLRELGAGPEAIVGILLERNADVPAAILGALKAGAAYLPLDPAYPAARLRFMLEDAQACAVVSQASRFRPLCEAMGGRLPVVLADEIPDGRDEAFPSGVESDNLAYVIYTSGSTGTPKAVAVEHRNAVALARWAARTYGPRELSGVMAGVSICFDPSILDLLVPLCLGGRVILAPNTLALPELAAADEVRMIFSVPSVVHELLQSGRLPASLETINLGGEPLSRELVRRLYALSHVRRVYDLFGPTETTTCSIFALRRPDGPATIGKPIFGSRACLLDENLRPVALGQAGELYIAGAGVTRGYLRRPQLTEERFLQVDVEGTKIRAYRTGDLCREGPSGDLEFLGRKDQQVKIRGFRIELGEIEACLIAHPGVRQTVVTAHAEASGEKRLVAYIVPRNPADVEEEGFVAALRVHLHASLPDHMVPATVIPLRHFTLTPNGKLDREALPAPARNRAAAGRFAASRTSTEQALGAIWRDLLGLPEVGVDDDFFQLGGDSLLFAGMLGRVEKKTGVKLPLEAIQQARSIRRFAVFVDGKRAAPPSPSVHPTPQARPARPPLFLVPGVGGGMLWGYANLARHLGADHPIYTFNLVDPGKTGEIDTVDKMAAAYVKELRDFQPRGPYTLGGYCFGGIIAYEMARLLAASGQSVSLVALMNCAPPDSSYFRFRWNPLSAIKFALNFAFWIDGIRCLPPARRRQFVRWKWKSLGRRARRLFGPSAARATPLTVAERVDLSGIPDEQRSLWDLHFRALDRHRTHPYPGDVLLIRARCHPIHCSYDSRHGWGEVAGGVIVRAVPGLHENLLEEPYVAAVARELRAALDAVHRPSAGETAPAIRGFPRFASSSAT